MADFARILHDWYQVHKRVLPWRETKDPYRIWVSEIILQQTRVDQGLDYYLRFIARFPDVWTLAETDESEVLKYWEGLGYYSRARNLLQAARQVCALGKFPDSYSEIRKLRGVGDYTAAAIASFAFGLPYAAVDGNVYRVLSRYYGVELPIDTGAGKKYFAALATETLDRKHPANYNQAIMDFGALQCVPKNPDCSACPFCASCVAFRDGLVAQLPIKIGKQTLRSRFFTFIYIEYSDLVALWRRGTADIWEGLYQPLLFEWEEELPDEIQLYKRLSDLFVGQGNITFLPLKICERQRLSHQLLHASFYRLSLSFPPDESALPQGIIWVEKNKLAQYAFPKMLAEMTGRLQERIETVE